MSVFKLPSQERKATEIDLSKYGGEGILRVYPIKEYDAIRLSDLIKKKAKEDNNPIATEEDVGKLISSDYSMEAIEFFLESAVYGFDGVKEFPLTKDQIYGLFSPIELFNDIMEVIEKSMAFPLAQTDGAESK